jgi:hypothetical protein
MRGADGDQPFSSVTIRASVAAGPRRSRTTLCDGLAQKWELEVIALGYILLAVGFIGCLYWQVRFLVLTYNQSLWWFFGCLFVPFVDWFFLFLNFKVAVKPFGLSLLGLLVAGLGGYMAGIVWPS